MSKLICTDAILGARETIARARSRLEEAIRVRGRSHPVGFPDTAYSQPVIYSFLGRKVETLGDLDQASGRLPPG